jgi:hypothetical protein
MGNIRKPNLLFAFLILFTLSLSIVTCQVSPAYVYGKSNNDSNGGGSDNGGSNDKGKHKGSDNGNGKGSDDGGSNDNNNDGGSNDNNNDGGSNDNNNDGGSNDNNNGGGSSNKNEGTDNKENTFLSQVLDSTVDNKYGNNVSYVSIKDTNNKTDFVPGKVTLTIGSKVVWLNKDDSDHTITLESKSKSDYPLLNSLILPNGMVIDNPGK